MPAGSNIQAETTHTVPTQSATLSHSSSSSSDSGGITVTHTVSPSGRQNSNTHDAQLGTRPPTLPITGNPNAKWITYTTNYARGTLIAAIVVPIVCFIIWLVLVIMCGIKQTEVNVGNLYDGIKYAAGKNLLTTFWFFNWFPVLGWGLGIASLVTLN